MLASCIAVFGEERGLQLIFEGKEEQPEAFGEIVPDRSQRYRHWRMVTHDQAYNVQEIPGRKRSLQNCIYWAAFDHPNRPSKRKPSE